MRGATFEIVSTYTRSGRSGNLIFRWSNSQNTDIIHHGKSVMMSLLKCWVGSIISGPRKAGTYKMML